VIRFKIAWQRVKENRTLIELILLFLCIFGAANWILRNKRLGFVLLAQVHRSSHNRTLRAAVEARIRAYIPDSRERPVTLTLSEFKHFFSTRIMVLKAPVSSAEKGVLHVKFSELIQELPCFFDMNRLLNDYILVLEPSWTGYCDAGILQYRRFNDDVFVLSPEIHDFQFLTSLNSNLIPVYLGPCDWVDPRISHEFIGCEKRFDIVMNAHWGESKRHYLLFATLAQLPKDIRVALIGVPWRGRTSTDILRLATYYGVRDQLTIFERLPYTEVMQICCQSKCGILLSLKEGGNKALAEMIFCDIPVILLEHHVGGIRKNIVPETGLIVRQAELFSSILELIDGSRSFSPRKWAMESISCFVSRRKLNDVIMERAISTGAPWSTDIVCRSNSPESRYCDDNDYRFFSRYNDGLATYLR
jgi:hypothetical protein